MKWLFVTPELPWPINHGTCLRVYHFARTLSQRGEKISILSYSGNEISKERYAEVGVDLLTGPQKNPSRRGKSRNWFGPHVYDKELADCISRQSGGYEVVVLVRPSMLQYSQEASRAGCVIADMVDDPVLEDEGRYFPPFNPVRWAKRIRFLACEYGYEQAFLPWINYSVFASDRDAESFSCRHWFRRAAFVPNGVDAAYFSRAREEENRTGGQPRIIFLGNMTHPPNEDAALYLLQRIAPLIWDKHPQVPVDIVGSNPSPRLRQFAGSRIRITGWVEDIRPYLWGAGVAVLGMRTGTGIKNKLLEAWAAGTPVVATPLACQGVPALDGENLLLGKTPKDLAEKTVQLLNDPEKRRFLSEAGRRTVEEQMTWGQAVDRLLRLASGSDTKKENDRCQAVV